MKKQIYSLIIITLFGFSANLNAQTDYALEFDGSNDAVVVSNFLNHVDITTKVTVEAWVYADSRPVWASIVKNWGPGWTDYGLFHFGLLNDGRLHCDIRQTNNSPKGVADNVAIPIASWQHVAFVADGSNIYLYRNGILVSGPVAYNGTLHQGWNPLAIGAKPNADGSVTDHHWNGKIDEVRIWNDGRTQAEIRANMYKELVGDEDNLVAYYNFNEGSGTTADNVQGDADLDGTLKYMEEADWITSTAPTPYYTAQDGDWNTNATWANGQNAPTNDWAIGEIKHDVTLTTAEVSKDITINSGKSLTINSTSSLTTDGILTNSGTLTISSDASGAGSLITNGTITNTGTINIQRYITDGVWHLISVPNNNTTSNTFSGDYLQTWDETIAKWEDVTLTTIPLVPVQGYGFWGVAKSTTHSFEGTPNTGDQSIALSYTEVVDEARDGANCLGNPYPSSIDWDKVSGYGAVYYWNGTAYEAYPETVGYGTGSRYIAPMQGFFIVKASDGPTTFSLTNDDRTHNGASSYYKEAQEFPANSLMLKTTANIYTDELFIHFQEESSADFEMQYDAYKFLSNTEGISQLFSFTGDNKLSIDVRPETETIQLGFQNNQNGIYQIGIKEMDGIPETIIEDTKTEIFHNLQNGDYEFVWNTNDAETRFSLHLKATGIDDLETSNTQIFAYQKTINIRSSEKLNNAQVSIIDMMGRTVYEQTLVDGQNESINVPLEDGVYLVQLVSDSGTQVEKVILK